MRQAVSGARVSTSPTPSSSAVRATVSPGTRRISPPAASSEPSISASAVESQAASPRPARLRSARTATARRAGAATGFGGGGALRPRRNHPSPAAMAASATIPASSGARPRRRTAGRAPLGAAGAGSLAAEEGGSFCSACITSVADANRSSGRISRHFRITASQTGSTSGTTVRGAGIGVVARFIISASGER